MENVKFCKDCRFAQYEGEITEFAKCLHPTQQNSNQKFYVTGQGEPFTLFYCTTIRTSLACGPDGLLFEPRD
jgi:hypothetical protein